MAEGGSMTYTELRAFTARVIANTSLVSSLDPLPRMDWARFGESGIARSAVAGLLNYELSVREISFIACQSSDPVMSMLFSDLRHEYMRDHILPIDPPFVPFYHPSLGPPTVCLVVRESPENSQGPAEASRLINALEVGGYTVSTILTLVSGAASPGLYIGHQVISLITTGDLSETIMLNRMREHAYERD